MSELERNPSPAPGVEISPVGAAGGERPPEAPAAAQVEPEVAPGAAAPQPVDSHRFRVRRSRPGERPRFDEFAWSPPPEASVLDALLEFRDRDPSLVFRHSCMHGSCGACGVRIDGHEALACVTRIEDLPRPTITVEPLRARTVIADLATDTADFAARMEPVGLPPVRSAEVPAHTLPPEGVRAYARFENCIECGLCLSACPVSRADSAYLGPAALAAARRLVEEPRGYALGPVLALASEPDSVWRCEDAMQCSAVCPEAVDPARSVIDLRRGIAIDRLKAFFGFGSRGSGDTSGRRGRVAARGPDDQAGGPRP
jgi:succinate dehydrogenase / fumarate reductase, iron-sulfur subunit